MTSPCQSTVDDARAALAAAGLAASPDGDLVVLLNAVFAASWVGDGSLDGLPPAPVVVACGAGAVIPECVTPGPEGVPCVWASVQVWREAGGYRVLRDGDAEPVAFSDLLLALAWAVEV